MPNQVLQKLRAHGLSSIKVGPATLLLIIIPWLKEVHSKIKVDKSAFHIHSQRMKTKKAAKKTAKKKSVKAKKSK